MHQIMAAAFKSPELVLERNEAAALSAAVASVAEFYPTNIDPRVMAWASLVTTASMIYGPRIYLIRERIKREAVIEAKETQGGFSVVSGGLKQ